MGLSNAGPGPRNPFCSFYTSFLQFFFYSFFLFLTVFYEAVEMVGDYRYRNPLTHLEDQRRHLTEGIRSDFLVADLDAPQTDLKGYNAETELHPQRLQCSMPEGPALGVKGVGKRPFKLRFPTLPLLLNGVPNATYGPLPCRKSTAPSCGQTIPGCPGVHKQKGWGEKICGEGGGLFEPHFQPPSPPFQGSNVWQPETVWEGLAPGVRGYAPTHITSKRSP